MQEQLMATYLTNADNEKTRAAILDGAKEAKMNKLTDETQIKALGEAYATMYAATAGVSTVKNFATGLTTGGKPATTATGGKPATTAAKPTNTGGNSSGGGDVVSMPGRTTTLVGDYGEIFLDPRDAVAAGPPAAIAELMSGKSSGNNADIVRAIADLKNTLVTTMLSKPAEGLNPPPKWS